MPLPSSGPLSLNDIAGEFGGSTPHSLSEYYAGGGLVPAGTSGTYGAVPSSGTISIQNFYGTSNIPLPKAIAVTFTDFSTSMPISAYAWGPSGFGAKYADPGAFPSDFYGRGLSFSKAGNYVGIGHSSGASFSVYPWSNSGFGTRYSGPSSGISGIVEGVAFSENADYVAAVGQFATFSVWPWSSSGFGSRYTDPGSRPAGCVIIFKFSPDGNFVAVAFFNQPHLIIYNWSSSGFGTALSGITAFNRPSGDSNDVAFSPDGQYVSVAHVGGANISTFPWNSSGIGTKYADPPSPGFVAQGRGVAFSPDSANIAGAHEMSPFLTVYSWSASGYGTKYANPAVLPADIGHKVSWSPVG